MVSIRRPGSDVCYPERMDPSDEEINEIIAVDVDVEIREAGIS